jgi:hypothetical protein
MPFSRRPLLLVSGIFLGLCLFGGVGVAMLAASGYWDLLIPRPPALGHTPVKIAIAGEIMTIPADRLRFPAERRSGEATKVELLLSWPELAPPGDTDPARYTTARDGKLIFVTMVPRETDLDTADRLATVYQRFLAPGDSDGPGGLVRRSFRPGSSYDGEELYFEPGTVHPFVARCYPARKGDPILTCLRDVKLGRHLMATIRFPVAALADWRRLRDGLDTIFAEISGEAAKGG